MERGGNFNTCMLNFKLDVDGALRRQDAFI